MEKIRFEYFLAKFPVVELPITLSEHTYTEFGEQNEPLPVQMIAQYLLPLEETEIEEDITEFVACFRLPDTKDFHAIVYWKAALLEYQYNLATFNKIGEFIDKKTIAGTLVSGNVLIQSVATIDTDWVIYVATGATLAQDAVYDANTSKVQHFELLPTGNIIIED